MTTFTPDEINLVTNIFAQSKVSPAAENAVEIVGLVQSVLRKMNELKEKTNGESTSLANGTAQPVPEHVESNGYRKDKAAKSVRNRV